MVSGHTAYNALLGTHPELVDELYGEFCFDRSHETEPGEDPITVGSVFTDTPHGVRIRYNRLHIELGHYRGGRPLTARRREALDALDRIINDPANYVEFKLDPGAVFFADNHVTLHNRWGFVDAPEVADRRCLVRLWLAGKPRNRTASPSHRRARRSAPARSLIDRHQADRRADLHTGAVRGGLAKARTQRSPNTDARARRASGTGADGRTACHGHQGADALSANGAMGAVSLDDGPGTTGHGYHGDRWEAAQEQA